MSGTGPAALLGACRGCWGAAGGRSDEAAAPGTAPSRAVPSYAVPCRPLPSRPVPCRPVPRAGARHGTGQAGSAGLTVSPPGSRPASCCSARWGKTRPGQPGPRSAPGPAARPCNGESGHRRGCRAGAPAGLVLARTAPWVLRERPVCSWYTKYRSCCNCSISP